VQKACFVLDQIRDYDVDGPVVFDMEHPEIGTDRILNVPCEEKTRIAKAFLSRVQKAGYKAMLYNSTGLFDEFFEMDMLGEFPLWAAEYGSLPHYSYMFEIWQYTNRGRVDGITGNVDMDIQFIPK
jgi:GH25 family lysozyme M1 (1,4-beta-N-acetylmuramidase)